MTEYFRVWKCLERVHYKCLLHHCEANTRYCASGKEVCQKHVTYFSAHSQVLLNFGEPKAAAGSYSVEQSSFRQEMPD